MIERITGPGVGVLGVRMSGRLAHEDYERLDHLIDAERPEGGRINLVCEVEGFEGWTLRAAFDDAELGLVRAPREVRRLAVVTDSDWIRRAVELFAPLMPYSMRAFALGEREAAWAWAAKPA